MTHLVYVADPMCSWCYGFGPELQGVLEALPDAKLDLIMGGLRAYNTEPMNDEKRASTHVHWHHVAEASGLPFSDLGMTQPGFVYDTEPSCRAVVATRTLAEDVPGFPTLKVFHAIQHAFYAQGQDVTQLPVLAKVATDALNQDDTDTLQFDEASFLETLQAPMTQQETREDFLQTQRWGVRGFPALLLLHNNALHMVAGGYTKTANVLATIAQVQAS